MTTEAAEAAGAVSPPASEDLTIYPEPGSAAPVPLVMAPVPGEDEPPLGVPFWPAAVIASEVATITGTAIAAVTTPVLAVATIGGLSLAAATAAATGRYKAANRRRRAAAARASGGGLTGELGGGGTAIGSGRGRRGRKTGSGRTSTSLGSVPGLGGPAGKGGGRGRGALGKLTGRGKKPAGDGAAGTGTGRTGSKLLGGRSSKSGGDGAGLTGKGSRGRGASSAGGPSGGRRSALSKLTGGKLGRTSTASAGGPGKSGPLGKLAKLGKKTAGADVGKGACVDPAKNPAGKPKVAATVRRPGAEGGGKPAGIDPSAPVPAAAATPDKTASTKPAATSAPEPVVAAAASHSGAITGGTTMQSRLGWDAATAQMVAAARKFNVGEGEMVEAGLHISQQLQAATDNLAEAMAVMNKKLQDEMPVHPTLVGLLAQGTVAVRKIGNVLSPWGSMFRRLHENDLRRHVSPRKGEAAWNVQRGGTAK